MVKMLFATVDRREQQRYEIAKAIISGPLSADLGFGTVSIPADPWPWVAEQAVKAADALLAELEKDPVRAQQPVPPATEEYSVCAIAAELSRLESERDEARGKALRFDLDAAGIRQREAEAIELVELRAALAREQAGRKVACVALLDLIVIADAGWYEGNEGHDWPEAVDAARAALAALDDWNI